MALVYPYFGDCWFIPFFMYRYYGPDELISKSMVRPKLRYSSPMSISIFIHSILLLVIYLFTRYGYFDLGKVIPYLLENAHCNVIIWKNTDKKEMYSYSQ